MAGLEADHSPASSVEVTNEWRHTPTPHMPSWCVQEQFTFNKTVKHDEVISIWLKKRPKTRQNVCPDGTCRNGRCAMVSPSGGRGERERETDRERERQRERQIERERQIISIS
jgi:hypothetical protein